MKKFCKRKIRKNNRSKSQKDDLKKRIFINAEKINAVIQKYKKKAVYLIITEIHIEIRNLRKYCKKKSTLSEKF